MKAQSKVVEIPATSTPNQMENALNNQLNNSWNLVTIFQLGTKTYAVLIRNIVE